MKKLLIPVWLLLAAACGSPEAADPYLQGYEETVEKCRQAGAPCPSKEEYRFMKIRSANEHCRLQNRINNTNTDCDAEHPIPSKK